jgi:CheY-like chemotaxis protein
VRQLVELHGGQVEATSEIGVGSRFFVPFPGRTELSLDEADPEPASRLALDLDGVRVLLVEDQQDARDILSAALQQSGVVVSEVGSSRAALAALDAALAAGLPPDLIISDIGLPEEDGYRLVELIGQRPPSRGGRIPVIALTAYGRPQDKRRALAAGFRMHLTKPITPGALAAAVATVVGVRDQK